MYSVASIRPPLWPYALDQVRDGSLDGILHATYPLNVAAAALGFAYEPERRVIRDAIRQTRRAVCGRDV